MSDKIKLLYLPFILTLIGLIISYTFLHWLIIIEFNLFSIKQIIVEFVVPLVLTGVFAWFILRPKFKILNLKSKGGSLRDFYSVIVWVSLTIPLVISQKYMISSTGALTELNAISEIENFPPSKYYTLSSSYIDKKAIGIQSVFKVTGKHNQNFNMQLFIAMPIFESINDTFIKDPMAWMGIEYQKRISNRLESYEKDEEYKQFGIECQKEFERTDFSDFIYLSRIGNSDDKDAYLKAIKNNPIYRPNETILIGVNSPFDARNGNKLQWVIFSSLIGSIVWLIMILIPKTVKGHLSRIKAGKPDKVAQREWKDFLNLFKPKDLQFITPIIVIINTGIFLLMFFMGLGFISFNGRDLLEWGANFRPITTNGAWWRLVSNTFLHGGFMHLLANMFGLLFIGSFLEPLLGRKKYLIVYLTSGILASLTSLWWYSATISVGASGAIFGLYGVFIALLLTKVYPPDFGKSFLFSILVFIGFNLLMGVSGGIDNAAHIGGLVSGFFIGLALTPVLNKQAKK